MKNLFIISFIIFALYISMLFASCTNLKNDANASPTPASLLIEPTYEPESDTAEVANNIETAPPQTQHSNDIQLEVKNYEEFILTNEDNKNVDIISTWHITTISDGTNLRGEVVFSIRENIDNIEFTFHPDGTFTRTTQNDENIVDETYVWDYIEGANIIAIRKAEEQYLSWVDENITFVELWHLYDVSDEDVSFYILAQSGSTALVFDDIIITAAKVE